MRKSLLTILVAVAMAGAVLGGPLVSRAYADEQFRAELLQFIRELQGVAAALAQQGGPDQTAALAEAERLIRSFTPEQLAILQAAYAHSPHWRETPAILDALMTRKGAQRKMLERHRQTVEVRLLVVDDEESILFAVREYFTARGFGVDCAQDVAAAKDLISRSQHAVVIADVRLGGIDKTQGLDLVRCLRRRWPLVRVILITAYGSRAIEAEARRLGVEALLDKPVRLGALAEIVETLVRPAPGPGPSPAS